MNSYTVQPVGYIRSTLKGREETPRQGPEGAPDLLADNLYQPAFLRRPSNSP